KPSRSVVDPSSVSISDPAKHLVSRAALKLEHALEQFGWSPKDKIALDIGASTGGFCQVLLQHGAAHVFGIDVGHDQMDGRISAHEQMTSIEGLNARDLTLGYLNNKVPEFITSDVSFISLKLALPPALSIAAPGAKGIFLIKPQFEVGKDDLGKGGIVRDPELAKQCASDLESWLSSVSGWAAKHLIPSPVLGGDGNMEFLLAGEKHA
ncbi:MAG: TlyA family RNA methyltransferase, partial [Rhizobiaceae bacterium]|nr:TlyA family RNA methyltransferase [Rhizobiaceae bacterium]